MHTMNLINEDGGEFEIDLRPVQEIPLPYREIFSNYPSFNLIQSQVLDDVLYSDESLVISAPTGSGKTAIFELAIVRKLMSCYDVQEKFFKIIYISPMKALCEERLVDWHRKFSHFGLSCVLVTGDSDNIDILSLSNHNLVITTPEKWDSLTRKWRDDTNLVRMVNLFLIDEVHLVNEESRGPTLEAIVSRMKIIEDAISFQSSKGGGEVNCDKIRFIALSATVSNIEDVASWIGKPSIAKFFRFSDEVRPVKLKTVVVGYAYGKDMSYFKFDLYLNYKLQHLLMQYSMGKPALIFCSTRKSTEITAKHIVQNLTINLNEAQRIRLSQAARNVTDKKVSALLPFGVAYHHAGLLSQTRQTIEQLFRNSELPVLVTTSTLAMGVNLPAHLVIIKSTKYYQKGHFQDYSQSALLQMIGRAGRPQYDTSATALILTTLADKAKFENIIDGIQPLESNLHRHLTEHLNAEVVLRTITNLDIALQWLSSTFLYIRAKKNPRHYGLPTNVTVEQLDKRLMDMCQIEINKLAKARMLTIDQNFAMSPTILGSLMAKYYIAFETMKLFAQVTGYEIMQQIINLISKCHEFSAMYLRVDDKKCLNLLNKTRNKQTIKFPLTGKIKTVDMKINCIIQAVLGCLEIVEQSIHTETNKIMRNAERIAKCEKLTQGNVLFYQALTEIIVGLAEYLETREKCFLALLNTTILAKCFHAQLWDDSPYVSKQLTGIGIILSNYLVNAGKNSFQKILESSPRELEMIMKKKPPFGDGILETVRLLPFYKILLDIISADEVIKLKLTVTLQNAPDLGNTKCTANASSKMCLLVGNNLNDVILYEKYSHSYMIENPEIIKFINVKNADVQYITAHFISETWVGIDSLSTLRLRATSTITQHENTNEETSVKEKRPTMLEKFLGSSYNRKKVKSRKSMKIESTARDFHSTIQDFTQDHNTEPILISHISERAISSEPCHKLADDNSLANLDNVKQNLQNTIAQESKVVVSQENDTSQSTENPQFICENSKLCAFEDDTYKLTDSAFSSQLLESPDKNFKNNYLPQNNKENNWLKEKKEETHYQNTARDFQSTIQDFTQDHNTEPVTGKSESGMRTSKQKTTAANIHSNNTIHKDYAVLKNVSEKTDENDLDHNKNILISHISETAISSEPCHKFADDNSVANLGKVKQKLQNIITQESKVVVSQEIDTSQRTENTKFMCQNSKLRTFEDDTYKPTDSASSSRPLNSPNKYFRNNYLPRNNKENNWQKEKKEEKDYQIDNNNTIDLGRFKSSSKKKFTHSTTGAETAMKISKFANSDLAGGTETLTHPLKKQRFCSSQDNDEIMTNLEQYIQLNAKQNTRVDSSQKKNVGVQKTIRWSSPLIYSPPVKFSPNVSLSTCSQRWENYEMQNEVEPSQCHQPMETSFAEVSSFKTGKSTHPRRLPSEISNSLRLGNHFPLRDDDYIESNDAWIGSKSGQPSANVGNTVASTSLKELCSNSFLGDLGLLATQKQHNSCKLIDTHKRNCKTSDAGDYYSQLMTATPDSNSGSRLHTKNVSACQNLHNSNQIRGTFSNPQSPQDVQKNCRVGYYSDTPGTKFPTTKITSPQNKTEHSGFGNMSQNHLSGYSCDMNCQNYRLPSREKNSYVNTSNNYYTATPTSQNYIATPISVDSQHLQNDCCSLPLPSVHFCKPPYGLLKRPISKPIENHSKTSKSQLIHGRHRNQTSNFANCESGNCSCGPKKYNKENILCHQEQRYRNSESKEFHPMCHFTPHKYISEPAHGSCNMYSKYTKNEPILSQDQKSYVRHTIHPEHKITNETSFVPKNLCDINCSISSPVTSEYRQKMRYKDLRTVNNLNVSDNVSWISSDQFESSQKNSSPSTPNISHCKGYWDRKLARGLNEQYLPHPCQTIYSGMRTHNTDNYTTTMNTHFRLNDCKGCCNENMVEGTPMRLHPKSRVSPEYSRFSANLDEDQMLEQYYSHYIGDKQYVMNKFFDSLRHEQPEVESLPNVNSNSHNNFYPS